jgi:hypothetical protein
MQKKQTGYPTQHCENLTSANRPINTDVMILLCHFSGLSFLYLFTGVRRFHCFSSPIFKTLDHGNFVVSESYKAIFKILINQFFLSILQSGQKISCMIWILFYPILFKSIEFYSTLFYSSPLNSLFWSRC